MWAMTLVALMVLAAERALGSHRGMPLGLLAAAVSVFILKNVWEEGSSFCSLPVRYWPPCLLVLAVITFFAPGTDRPGHYSDSASQADKDTATAIASFQGALPRTVYSTVRLERAEFSTNALRFGATTLPAFDGSPQAFRTFEQQARNTYCGDGKNLVKRNISVGFDIQITPRTLNDRIRYQAITLDPSACQ